MVTGRAGATTLYIAFNPDAAVHDREAALARIAAEYGPGFAAHIAESVEVSEMISRNRADALRISRNARQRAARRDHT
jgi:hypothetical protein